MKRVVIVIIMGMALLAALVSMSVSPQQVVAASLPCDIYAAGGTPCVAAHSTVRALFAAYSGRLYQVRRASDSQTTDIATLSAGGIANAAAQDSFCVGTTCTITIIYDQTTRGNNLTVAPAGGNGGADVAANASALPLTIGGNKVYGVSFTGGVGYRNNATSGVATGSQPQGEYMVTSGSHFNNQCCFDYGNAETNNRDNGNGHMDALYFGSLCWFSPCSGSGPWVMADMENGLFAGGNGSNTNNLGNNSAFVTAMLKNNGTATYAIKGGNAQSGSLTTWYSGALPTIGGYTPMSQEGAIILGIGGDNSNVAVGSFFEGAMTSGYPSDSTDASVQASIVSAGYGTGPTPTPAPTQVPQTNPVVWYKFDGNTNDSSGNGKNATAVNGPTFTTGKIGQAIHVAGGSQYVSVPANIMSGMTNFTVASWVNVTTNSAWARLFDFGTSTTSYMFLAPQSGSGTIRFAITTTGNGSEQQLNGASALSTGTWHHVAVTLSGSTGTLYVDGAQVAQNTSMTLNPSSLGTTSNDFIGKSQFSADPHLNGLVDDFRLYNRALSASEVQALWNGGGATATPTVVQPPTNTPPPTTPSPTPTITPPIVWYKFDGNTLDSSGNGKNATVVNGPTVVNGKVGQAINIAGGTQYISVPASILSGVTNFSISAWVNVTTNGAWARLFDFGSNTTSYMFLTPQSGSGAIRYAITTSGNGHEQQLNGASALSTGTWHHVVVTLSGSTGTLYVDGAQVAQSTSMTLNPSSLGATSADFIGKSQFSADPDLNGAVDQFEIYNYALTAAQVQFLFQNL